MQIIDHFRHSIRMGEHLSREGVALARKIGAILGEYDLVVTSELPRAIETAIAMGYGVDRYEGMLGATMPVEPDVDWTLGCTAFAAAAKAGGITHHACQSHADLLHSIAADLPPDGRALVVSHSGVIELGVVGLVPEYDYSTWGPACERCEGVRMYFEGDSCTGAEIMRIAQLLPTT